MSDSDIRAAWAAARSAWPAVPRVTVALSGGADSTAVALLAAELGTVTDATTRLLHVHHDLQPEADDWAEHCVALGARLGLPVDVRRVIVGAGAKGANGGPEAAAREVRHAVYAKCLAAGELVVLGHHLEDQAETLLLRLMRGTGLDGLAAMAPLQARGGGWLARPLLDVSRSAIEALLDHHDLDWVSDPSNTDDRFDRAWLRHRLLPRLRERWPAADRMLARTARLAREERCATGGLPVAGATHLAVADLAGLSSSARRQALRRWLAGQGAVMPSMARLAEMERQVLDAAPDRMPVVAFGTRAVRRYRGQLYCTPAELPMPTGPAPLVLVSGPALDVGREAHETTLATGRGAHAPIGGTDLSAAAAQPALGEGAGAFEALDDDVRQRLHMRVAYGNLVASPVRGRGLALAHLQQATCEVRYRAGGENVRLGEDGGHLRLKALLQGAGVPPWLRPLLPLVHVDGELAVVPDQVTALPFRAGPGEPGLEFHWLVPNAAEPPEEDRR